jgi:hypothetical protein
MKTSGRWEEGMASNKNNIENKSRNTPGKCMRYKFASRQRRDVTPMGWRSSDCVTESFSFFDFLIAMGPVNMDDSMKVNLNAVVYILSDRVMLYANSRPRSGALVGDGVFVTVADTSSDSGDHCGELKKEK